MPPLPWTNQICQNCTWGLIYEKYNCQMNAYGVIKCYFVGMKSLLRELGELFENNKGTKNKTLSLESCNNTIDGEMFLRLCILHHFSQFSFLSWCNTRWLFQLTTVLAIFIYFPRNYGICVRHLDFPFRIWLIYHRKKV